MLIGEEVNLNSEEKKEQILQEKTSALEAEKQHVGNRMVCTTILHMLLMLFSHRSRMSKAPYQIDAGTSKNFQDN